MRHRKVPAESLLLIEQVSAYHLQERPPLHVVIAEPVLQVRLLDPGQTQSDFCILSRDTLKSTVVVMINLKFESKVWQIQA